MSSRITILSMTLISAILVGCPMMPQPGVGPSRAVLGDTADNAASGAGKISVVNDESRGQAVYINASGQRFDVTAGVYPGGPQVRCVQMVDFIKVEPSADADALPVKAIVAGMRDDGTPGIWEIHLDDSILLSQPEQTGDNAARSIMGGDITTLPEGLQSRHGWMFTVGPMSTDAKIIVGFAKHPKGFTFNATQVMPTSTVAVYWRVYKLPYGRFCIISPPRVIGVVTKPVRPAGWEPHGLTLSSVLVQLRQFFLGRFESYLTTADSVQLDGGLYKVRGLDELGLAAVATIDKNTVTSITEVPDLTVSNVTFSPATADVAGTLSLSAVVKDLTDGPANPATLKFYLSTDNVLDINTDVLIAQVDPTPGPGIPANGSIGPISIEAPLANLAIKESLKYYVLATVIADLKDGEVVTTNNTAAALDTSGAPALLTLTAKTAETHPDLKIEKFESVVPSPATALGTGDLWPFTVVVKNAGTAISDPTTLRYRVSNANGGFVDLLVNVLTLGPDKTFTDTLESYRFFTDPPDLKRDKKQLGDLKITSGTNTITVSVDVVTNETVTGNNEWVPPGVPPVPVTLPVMYPELVIDTYYPLAPPLPDPVKGDLSNPNGINALYLFNAGFEQLTADEKGASLDAVFHVGWAYIRYAGVAPGVYYVRIQPRNDNSGAYAIRVLQAPAFLDVWPGRLLSWFYDPPPPADPTTGLNPTDAPYEALDGVSPTIPSNEAPMSFTAGDAPTPNVNMLNRFLGPKDYDWVKITLP